MVKSLKDKCKEFCYSSVESAAISNCLPEPAWPDSHDNWHPKLSLPTKSEIRKDKEGRVARYLEGSAINFFLKLYESPLPPEDELRTIDQIGRLSKKLHNLLASPISFSDCYATVFLGIDGISFDEEKRQSVLMSDLKLIAEQAGEIRDYLKSANRIVSDKIRDPELFEYVETLTNFWMTWTEQPAGGSKVSGPAARFVMNTFNPVAVFAKTELGVDLRPNAKGSLTEEAAGNLIHYYRKAAEFKE